MKPLVTVITLCVDDLERSLSFYSERLGFETEGIVGREHEFGVSSSRDATAPSAGKGPSGSS